MIALPNPPAANAVRWRALSFNTRREFLVYAATRDDALERFRGVSEPIDPATVEVDGRDPWRVEAEDKRR